MPRLAAIALVLTAVAACRTTETRRAATPPTCNCSVQSVVRRVGSPRPGQRAPVIEVRQVDAPAP